jgi:hypothetical protein
MNVNMVLHMDGLPLVVPQPDEPGGYISRYEGGSRAQITRYPYLD